MMKKYIQLVLIILSLPYLSLGQEIREIRGTIVDSSTGDVLPGATVQIKDTTNGTIADYEGNFTIQASPEDVLMFSFIGFQPKEISVGDKTTFNIKLEPDIESLEEVVVVGYTSKKKKDLVGSVSVVDMEEVGKVVYANPLQALQGRVAGVNFTQTGEPGSVGTGVQIRGVTTFGNVTPLYVVDGIPTQEPPNNLNSNDIASIQVLKDAAASVYGARAAGGVILINTKQGKTGQLRIDAGLTSSVQTRANYLDLLDAEEWGQVYWEAYKNSRTGSPSFTGYFDLGGKPGIPTDPQLYQPDKDDPSKNQSYQ